MEAGLMDRTDNGGNDNERIGRQFSGNEVPHVNNSGISADELYRRTHHAMLEDEPHPNSNDVVGEDNVAPSLQHVNERWLVHRDTGYMARENMDDVEDSRNVTLVDAYHYQQQQQQRCNDSGGDHADVLHSRVHYQQNDQLVINNYSRSNLAPSRLPQRDGESRSLANEENVVVNDSRHGDREEVDVDLHAHDRLIVLLNRRITDMVFGHAGNEEYYIF
jgi:hypothetical protein